MSFNDQVNNLSTGGGGYSIFKEGVKTKWLTGDAAILFRILPAYNHDDRDGAGTVNPAGWVPSRMQDGKLTAWGGIVKASRFVGHGHGKGANRRDFLSPYTFSSDSDVFCPASVLYATASQYAEWQHIVEDERDASGRLTQRAPLSRPGEFLVMNIVELGGVTPEVTIGCATKSTTDALVSPSKGGLVTQRANVTAEQVAADYLCQWAVRDLCDPTDGPVTYVMKGERNRYVVGLAEDPTTKLLRRHPVDGNVLAARYDLSDLHNILEVKDAEAQVLDLVKTFNTRSPAGQHEFELLKLAFGSQFSIPDAPMAPAASNTVAPGFAPPAAAPAQGFAPPAAAPAPYVAPDPAAPAPYVAPAPAPVAAAPVPIAPPAPNAQVTIAPAVAPGMGASQVAAMAERLAALAAPAVGVPPAPPVGVANAPGMPPAPVAGAPVAPPAVAGAPAPVAPGDPVGPSGDDAWRQNFLAGLRKDGEAPPVA